MPKGCEVCDFRKSDPYSGEVYCAKAIGNNTIIYEKERLDNCPLVEIITCKDCTIKQFDESESYEVGAEKYYCPIVSEYVDQAPNCYCANGERKE